MDRDVSRWFCPHAATRCWLNMSRQQHPHSASFCFFVVNVSVCLLRWFLPLCLLPVVFVKANMSAWLTACTFWQTPAVSVLWWIDENEPLSRIQLQMDTCSYSEAVCRHDLEPVLPPWACQVWFTRLMWMWSYHRSAWICAWAEEEEKNTRDILWAHIGPCVRNQGGGSQSSWIILHSWLFFITWSAADGQISSSPRFWSWSRFLPVTKRVFPATVAHLKVSFCKVPAVFDRNKLSINKGELNKFQLIWFKLNLVSFEIPIILKFTRWQSQLPHEWTIDEMTKDIWVFIFIPHLQKSKK